MDEGETRPKRQAAPRGVTMEAVGRLAGVSQVTVSRALSDPARVSPETLRRITEAIEATGFVPNAIAGALASRRSRLISALVPSITNIVYSAMLQTFSERMREAGYQILLSETGLAPEDEEQAVAVHLSRRPDAILLTGVHHSAQTRRMLLASGIPVVEVWDYSETPVDICVGFSHVETGRAAAEFAFAQGYRQAATVSAGDERALRRKRAFAERFAALTGAPVASVDFAATASLARGREGLARLLGDMPQGQVLVHCSSDILAHGVMVEAAARGLRVPRDIAVMGFGDQDFAADIEPALTTIRVDREAFGRAAADALLARLAGEGAVAIDLGFEVVQRRSA